MKNGLPRFEFYLSQLEQLLGKAAKQKNPALFLYKNNAHTPLFMLEGLSKLYAGLHNKKKFTKLKEHFKTLEDILGAVDYYDAFAKEFAANKNIPQTVTAYLQAQTREKIQNLNEVLLENGWTGDNANRIKKARKKLKKADWENGKEEVESICKFYRNSIKEIIDFVEETGIHFDNVESEVHELRRKLRWLSIYPQALRGCIQLGKSAKAPSKALAKYLTKEIINSPFNKLPDAGNNEDFLLLDQNYFYSLSWMIAELGKLKDNGLRVIAIKEALQQTGSVSDADALQKAYQFCSKAQIKLPDVLNAAEKIASAYFKEKNLQSLVIGTGNIS